MAEQYQVARLYGDLTYGEYTYGDPYLFTPPPPDWSKPYVRHSTMGGGQSAGLTRFRRPKARG